ncbi:sarcosine oxidase [Beauveria brongniartii RCEF 3172]|uniref:Sarcosine oxidase n=1 Tax=Beauveria brongniartii RCEF 3172 TaxID=1081107 RepID=A0A167IDS3_9HYPO|nr:sarcosine oxidase [Beauveria brongniartii RCEF 3172]
MEPMLSSKSSPIAIMGAGVFGLCTAIHLAERGYTNVKVLDRQAYQQTQYRYKDGCDSVSADINKIIRAAYGSQFGHQTLALDAIAKWKKWNEEIRSGKCVSNLISSRRTLSRAWTEWVYGKLNSTCTTAGSVVMFQLPPDEALWNKFAPDNFPTWSYGRLYGFARGPDGSVKIGYRGTKFTNPQVQPDSTVRSVPVTRWTQHAIHSVPEIASRTIQKFVREQLPELIDCATTTTRLCWYTDSYDNHFVIDVVPQKRGLMVATGGSGHGFKFLPNLGEHVVDRIEGKTNGFLEYWKWRARDAGVKPYNSIMEGVESDRSLWRQPLVNLNCATKQYSGL